MVDPSPPVILAAMSRAADRAGDALRALAPREYGDPDLDRRLEGLILDALDPILTERTAVFSEESTTRSRRRTSAPGPAPDPRSLVVYVDPLDGTEALRMGAPEASVALAARRGTRWLAALVEAPLVNPDPTAPTAGPGDRISWCAGERVRRNGEIVGDDTGARAASRSVLIPPRQEWAHAVHRAQLAPASLTPCASTAYRMARTAVADVAASVDWLPSGRSVQAWDVACGLALADQRSARVGTWPGSGLEVSGLQLTPTRPRLIVTGRPSLVEHLLRRYARADVIAALDEGFADHQRRLDESPD